MATLDDLTAATDRLTAGLAKLDDREKAEAGAGQAKIDAAVAAVNAAADHVDTLDVTPAPAPAPTPGPTPAPAAFAVDPKDNKPVYTFAGSGTPDPNVWAAATVKGANGEPLFTFNGDTAGGQPTGASATWVIYNGAVTPL